MPIVRPQAVSPGDMVAVVSTSWGGAGLLAERFQRGVLALASLGYKVRVMPHALGTTDGVRGWVSGTREERLKVLASAEAAWQAEIQASSDFDAWTKDRTARRTALLEQVRIKTLAGAAHNASNQAAVWEAQREAVMQFDASEPELDYYRWVERRSTMASAR